MSNTKRRIYTQADYTNKLLLGEKKCIITVLKITRGNLKIAHKILCPEKPTPYLSYTGLVRKLQQHSINLKDYKR